jgi:hypothetical protein
MTGTYLVQDWEFLYQLENRRQTRRNSVGSVEELYNEIENRSLQVSKRNPFKGFEIGNMDESIMI